MKSKIKTLVLILITVLLVVSGTLYLLFGYVPIAGSVIANNKLSKYSGTSVSATYRFPYDDGYSTVIDNDRTLIYHLKHNTIADNEVSTIVQNEVDKHYQKIRSILEHDMQYPNMIQVRTWIDADDYQKRFHRLDILSVFNKEQLKEEESMQMASTVALSLIDALGSMVHVKSLHVVYADSNGMYECIIDFNRNVDINEALLVESTRKLSDSELPEDYIEWLEMND